MDDYVDIERTNRTGYNLLAPYYSDTERKTTANFHFLSTGFFQKSVSSLDLTGQGIDLGAGRGFLESILKSDRIYCLDLAIEMLRYVTTQNKICGSVTKLPFKANSFDYAISSLSASFLVSSGIEEIHRILKPKGYFVFTTVTKTWADGVRKAGENEKTTFKIDSRYIEVYSFTYTDADLQNLLVRFGFNVVNFEVITGSTLKQSHQNISTAIQESANNNLCSVENLPIIQAVWARKSDEI